MEKNTWYTTGWWLSHPHREHWDYHPISFFKHILQTNQRESVIRCYSESDEDLTASYSWVVSWRGPKIGRYFLMMKNGVGIPLWGTLWLFNIAMEAMAHL